ncbi:hypothetical protein F5884DRAFT_389320 [Xylogone sp. PMI_703]|nr:hypothetical protein F5884DRAFT_389320 [Xylogone sp. PMI_703]
MSDYSRFNPFIKHESYSPSTLTTYKILSVLSWLLLVVTAFYYSFNTPDDDKVGWRHTIWQVNHIYLTAYSLNALIVKIYWIALFILQIGYLAHFFSSSAEHVVAAAHVGSHFIFNNLLQFAFIMLLVRSHFIWSEVILAISFLNLAFAYLHYPTYVPFIHVPAVAGPLAWSFVALYWNGAILVDSHSVAARVVAWVAIWGILVIGAFFLIVFKDYSIGFAFSILTASIGVRQFHSKPHSLQWIFAFTIMAVLFVASATIATLRALGKDITFRREPAVVEQDTERAPLLDNH